MSNVLNGTVPETGEIKGTISTKGAMSGGIATAFGKDGKSAYEVAVKNGFEGSEAEWLESLVGADGVSGTDGENGTDGKDGKSAYEIALDNGFEGTEEEWLESLKGEKGDTGDAFTYDDFTPEQLASLKGDKGETGEKGDTGNSGVYLGSGEMPEDCNVQIDPEGDVFEIAQTTGDSETKVMSQKAVTEALANVDTGTGSEEVVDEKARWQFIKDRFSANFDLDKLTLDENGLSLKVATGLPDHTNVMWLKGQKDSEFFEFNVTADDTSRNGYIRFYISSREDINNFLFFQCAVIPQNGSTYVSFKPHFRTGGTHKSSTQVQNTFAVVKDNFKYNFKLRVSNGILYVYWENLFVGKMDLMPYFSKSITLGCSYRSPLPNNILAYKYVRVKEANTPYMHISYDDCIVCLQDINTNAATYTSIFDNAFLASLREWHMKYGAVFTLNLFQYATPNTASWNLANMTTKFKTEFTENADWLKFAVHWTMAGVKPSTDLTDADVVTAYNTLANAIIAFSSVNNLDRMIRPSYYSLSKSQQIALKNSLAIFDGCLTADIARTDDCGLTTAERNAISSVDDYMDYENDIYYCRTTTRMENFADDDARIAHLNSELADRKNNRAFIVFTHKDDGTAPSLEAVCKWAYEHGIRFDYPMYNIPKFEHEIDAYGTAVIDEL